VAVSAYIERVLFHAGQLVGIRETAPNRGPEVDALHLYAGRDPAQCDSWCAQAVFWAFGHAAEDLHITCPCPKTSSVLGLWQRSPLSCRVADPQPGDVFLVDHGKGKGHAGIIVEVDPTDPKGQRLITREGNTNPAGSRNGDGYYQRTRQRGEINLGLLRFDAVERRVA
jgi:hypothetical protein